jgi:DNA-binding GntR family transcriptional regulator
MGIKTGACMLEQLKAHTPLRDEVFFSLRNAILEGRLHPGERLVEKELAQSLSISRTPIREALRKLELEGLVAHEPHRGVIVVGVSQAEAAEIYTIRAVLEGLAARLAASRRTDADVAQLKRLLSTMEQCIQSRNFPEFVPLHVTFHQSFTSASKSSRLCQMISALWDYVKSFEKASYSLPARLQSSCDEHRQIVGAIECKDENLAEEAARTHIMRAKEAFLEGISEK